MKKLMVHTIPVILTILLVYCSNDPKTNKTSTVNNPIVSTDSNTDLNISFLLDLSDRINPKKYPKKGMEFYQRDVGYIKSVAMAFDNHLRAKKVNRMDDKIQLFFDPEPYSTEINTISEHLKFHVTKKNASLQLLDTIVKAYSTKPLKIYDLAIKDDQYVGSNTWHFFKNKVKDFCIEEGHRNILILLTDGYIYHKDYIMKEENYTTYLTPKTIHSFHLNTSKWKKRIEAKKYGFISATTDLDNLEILLLGINPDLKNPYEEDVLKTYWSNWFDQMGVKKYEIKGIDLPDNMDKVIGDFILKN